VARKQNSGNQRANAKNPNNPANKAARDNRANQMNTTHSSSHQGGSKKEGKK